MVTHSPQYCRMQLTAKNVVILCVIFLLFGFSNFRGNAAGSTSSCIFDTVLHKKEWQLFNDADDQKMRKEIDFILYMMGRGDLQESLFLIRSIREPGIEWQDSLHFLTGWVHYLRKDLQASAGYLLRVSPESPVYHKSAFFGAYNLAHTGNTSGAAAVLSSVEAEFGTMPYAMRHLQMSGVALLDRNFELFAQHSGGFSGHYHVMAAEERRMLQHYERLRNIPGKSPFVGGMLSAAIPGLGKIYAGKTGEGIVGFLYVAALGLTSYDFYRGSGAGHPLFILSATVTGIFYFGNIMGSAAAVRRSNNELKHEMDQRILFDMHIPLRNAFN